MTQSVCAADRSASAVAAAFGDRPASAQRLHTTLVFVFCVADVKPSNVLINTQGQVKMCDFGISGYLVDSVAKTMDAGCKPYMAVSRKNRKSLF